MPQSSVDLPGFASPAAGFEVPLEMLSACHGRVQKQCDTLRRLLAHVNQHGADAQAQSAAASVLRYFDTSAQHHHADEEDDLFPAMLRAARHIDQHASVKRLVDTLVAEHRLLASHWARIRPSLLALHSGQLQPLPADDVHALLGIYDRHIACEEDELLPLAATLLDLATLDRVGAAMRERRGVAAP